MKALSFIRRGSTQVSAGFALACSLTTGVAHAQGETEIRFQPTDMWLDSLDIRKMTSGLKAAAARETVEGQPLKLGGVTYGMGVGTHADSVMSIAVNGATRFSAVVGVDDSRNGRGSVRFVVYVDGKKQADSGIMRGGDAPVPLSVSLAGARVVTLHTDPAEDGNTDDLGDWVNAFFTLPAGASFPFAVDPVRPAVTAPPVTSAPINSPQPADTPFIAHTSSPAGAPAIHGARVTGTTPGRPFLFKIAATGQEPLRYGAANLPPGLQINERSGIITGTTGQEGQTVVQITVQNAVGKAQRNLIIVAGQHKLAQTPPMGWSSWNAYQNGVDEQKIRDAIEGLRRTGLDRHGYEYILVDDGWQGVRAANGEMLTANKFRDMKALGDAIHDSGFKLGIYSSPGPLTCGGLPGSWSHEEQDVRLWESWGVDYLKYDWCSYDEVGPVKVRDDLKVPFRLMRQLLDKSNLDIVFSMSQNGWGDVQEWAPAAGIFANSWRLAERIEGNYDSMAKAGFGYSGKEPFAGPGRWNDLDLLQLHALTPTEQLTHLSLWALQASPLFISSDVSQLTPFTINALSNDEVIDIHQDPLGKAAGRRVQTGLVEVWSRPLWDGTLAVGLFNRDKEARAVSARWTDLMLRGAQPVRDLWQQKDLGLVDGAFTTQIPGHGVVLVKIGQPKTLDYLP